MPETSSGIWYTERCRKLYKPIGELNEHPEYANVLEGDEHLDQVLHLIEQSPM